MVLRSERLAPPASLYMQPLTYDYMYKMKMKTGQYVTAGLNN